MYVFIPMLKLYFERLMTLLLGLDILKTYRPTLRGSYTYHIANSMLCSQELTKLELKYFFTLIFHNLD